MRVVPRSIIRILVYALIVSITIFSVISAGLLILSGAPDSGVATILRGFAVGLLVLILTDLILLVVALGLNATDDHVTPPEP